MGCNSTLSRTIRVGFRTFGPTGVGTDAMFRLNGKRIRLYSSISWGFWGLNGLFPVPELAEKEVTQAKKLGLNCLNFHRNLAKEEVLRNHDRLGLLRYLEPGAGKLAVGKLPANVAANSAGIVMEKPTSRSRQVRPALHVRQVRRDGEGLPLAPLGHPVHAAKRDRRRPPQPRHARRPRRHARRRPFTLHRPERRLRRPSAQGRAGLVRAVERQASPQRRRRMGRLVEPAPGRRRPVVRRVLQVAHRLHLPLARAQGAFSEFGEMEGCATPDNHALMLHQITTAPLARYSGRGGSQSYDLVDHQQIDDATNAWLTKWGFRKAFPTTEALYNALGKKCYDTWQNYLENARISDDLDFAVISGWESTSDRKPLRHRRQPAQLQVRPRAHRAARCSPCTLSPSSTRRWSHSVEPATFDLFLLNDTGRPATGHASDLRRSHPRAAKS